MITETTIGMGRKKNIDDFTRPRTLSNKTVLPSGHDANIDQRSWVHGGVRASIGTLVSKRAQVSTFSCEIILRLSFCVSHIHTRSNKHGNLNVVFTPSNASVHERLSFSLVGILKSHA
jgi:hypothetical protein